MATISPLRVMATICGAMLVALGVIALTAVEFHTAAPWVIVAGLAASGIAGLASLLRRPAA